LIFSTKLVDYLQDRSPLSKQLNPILGKGGQFMKLSKRVFFKMAILAVALFALSIPRGAASQGEKTLSAMEIADRLEIHELMARYSFGINFGDIEGWVACFTEDAVFETPLGTHRGSDALRKYVSSRGEERRERPVRHFVTNVIVTELQGDQASAKSYFLMTRVLRDSDTIQFLTTGIYTDKLRKTGGKWRISHRKIELDTLEWSKQVFPPSYLNKSK
jgi:3-phenylpropionate/cinnamic acid dioxygenase small subunit